MTNQTNLERVPLYSGNLFRTIKDVGQPDLYCQARFHIFPSAVGFGFVSVIEYTETVNDKPPSTRWFQLGHDKDLKAARRCTSMAIHEFRKDGWTDEQVREECLRSKNGLTLLAGGTPTKPPSQSHKQPFLTLVPKNH